jgi:hypothetical protein
MKPIDPVALEILDYFEVVTCPMDLSTIRVSAMQTKLTSDSYTDPYELCYDFDLLVENVRLYFTDPTDPIRSKAEHLKELFNRQWRLFLDKPEPEQRAPRKVAKVAKVVKVDLTEKERLSSFLRKVKASTAFEYLQTEELISLTVDDLETAEVKSKLQSCVIDRLHSIPSIHANTVKAIWEDAQRKRQVTTALSDQLDFDAMIGWTPDKLTEDEPKEEPPSPQAPIEPPKPIGLSVDEYIRASQVALVDSARKASYRELLILMFY